MLTKSRLHVPPGGLLLPGHGLLVDWSPPRPGILGVDRDGRPIREIAGGAWTASGLYLLNWIDILDATQLAIDTSLTTHKWAMYNNTETPNFSSETAYSVTNEVTGTNYTAGGKDLTGLAPTTTESPAGTLMYDMGDISWASSTITAYGAKLYADVLAGNNLICALNFGGAYTSTNGTFTIQFNALGVFYLDLTP